MTDNELTGTWARALVEAWVDGTLSGENRARMAEAIRRDASLKAAVERAASVRRALRSTPAIAVPSRLRGRLLAIAAPAPRAWRPALAAATVAVVAVAVWLGRSAPEPEPDPRVVAIQEFELAMRYLQKSARITRTEITSAVGTGLMEAVSASRAALERDKDETGG
jgi:hypothetical protein